MNYAQLTNLFRVEERAGPVRDREHREHPDHRRHDRPARRRARQGRDGRGRRQLHRHARRLPRAARLPPLPARPAVRPRALPRDEPLRHAARAVGARSLWAINFVDRLFVGHYKGMAEVGVYSLAVRIVERDRLPDDRVPPRVARVRLLDRRRLARRSGRTRSCSPTCCFVCCWMSLALGVLAPWIVKILAPSSPAFYRADEAVGAARVRRERVRRLHRARDRHRPRAPDAVQLDRQRRRRGR